MNSSVLSGKVKCVENPPQKTGAEGGRNFAVWLQDTKKADGIQGNLTENPREKQQKNSRFAKYAHFLLFGGLFRLDGRAVWRTQLCRKIPTPFCPEKNTLHRSGAVQGVTRHLRNASKWRSAP